jgi:YVTN family beta-propeller protein
MRRMLVTAAGVAALTVAAIYGQEGPYRLIQEIRIGGEGGWDYLSVDPARHRLYVSHATKAVVVDTVKDTVIGEITDTPGIHGAVAGPDDRIFTSNGRADDVSIVDATTLRTAARVKTEGNPDFILFEPTDRQVYTFNGRGNSASVIDAAAGKVVWTIPLGGKPEAAVTDQAAGRIYVNIEDRSQVAVIDRATHAVVASWPIAPGEQASGLAIDTAHHRLFIGAHNHLMLMMDSTSGKIVAQVPIGSGVDATWYDPGTGYAFSSCGDGTTTVAHEDSPTVLTVVQTLKTAQGARTMTVDLSTHRIYLPTAEFGPPPADAPAGRRWPTVVPGSMKILVYGLNGR